MKAHFRFLCLCLAMLCVGAASRAQITGTMTVPSTLYPTLKVAIDSLNNQGIGGNVTLNFTAATNETAPVGGYRLGSTILNASTSSTKLLTINGNANVITAYVGTSTTADGIFYIRGTDYVTINNLTLLDPTTNTTTTTSMEWGYVLCKLNSAAPYDGCQYDKINGCTIMLRGIIFTGTRLPAGISAQHTAVASSSVLSTASALPTDGNNYNQFTGNNITGVSCGVSLVGISTLAAYDKSNQIGGTTSATGNAIVLAANPSIGSASSLYGTYTQYDSVITIQNNKISFETGLIGTGTAYQIYMATGVGDMSILNNTMDLTCAKTGGSVYGFYNYGISSGHGDASSVTTSMVTTHTITGNKITGSNTDAAALITYASAIYEYYAYCKTLNVSNNTIQDMNWNASYIYCVYTYYNGSPFININNNTAYNITNRYTSGYVYGYYLYHYNTTTGIMNVTGNTLRKATTAYYMYAYYVFGPGSTVSGFPNGYLLSKNNTLDSIDGTGTTTYIYNYMAYYGYDSSEASGNRITNIKPNSPANNTMYLYTYCYGGLAANLYTIKKNFIGNTNANQLYMYNYLGYYGTRIDSNTITNITLGTVGTVATYLSYYATNPISSNNIVSNINTSGASVSNYMAYYGTNSTARNNTFKNINVGGSGTFYNYFGYYATGANLYNNIVDSISVENGTLYGWYGYTNNATNNIYNNNMSNLSIKTSTTAVMYPFYFTGTANQTNIYNNFLSKVNVPSGFNSSGNLGIYLAAVGPYSVFHNTINLRPTATGASFGWTGIYFLNTSLLDLRNNIINVSVTPGSTGLTAALRRSAGTAGVSPANFLGSSDGNIYYAPNVANSWLYSEGLSTATQVNTFNITNDPNFNTPCGLFKGFVGHEKSSFTENNLIAGPLPNTYWPTGLSYAKNGAVPTTNPAVTTDYALVARPAVADMGALQFSGTSLDNAPPIISYPLVPLKSYCVSVPTLVATITDNTGVNTTPGKSPRLYYKKETENNVFGGGNTSATNGWKYVEASSISGSLYTFIFDYSLLTSAVVPGDSITYFVIAEDLSPAKNTGATIAGFPVCPSTVALGTPQGPLNAGPVPNGFKILSTPVFQASGFPGSVCGSGSSVISIVPTPVGATVQWQTATLTGAFTNITGATGTSYTTPVNTTTLRYRALIICGTSTLTTTAIDTFIVALPSLLGTTGATRCGYGSVTLNAAPGPFTTPTWYTTATGGSAVAIGSSFTTPNLFVSKTYYVSANTPNASTEILTKTPQVAYSNNASAGYGMELRLRNPSTHFYSTTVYPYNATAGSSFMIDLLDSATGNSVLPAPAGPFSVSGGSGTTPVVCQLNWLNLPAGTYQMIMTNVVGGPYLNYEYLYAPTPLLPYTSPSGNATFTRGYIGAWYNNYYVFFYNNILGANCENATRTPVTATVTPAPAITATSPDKPGICLGSTATLNVTSPSSGYFYTWTPGTLTGATQTVTPGGSTLYYVTATNPFTGCVNIDSVQLFVNPQPSPPTIAPKNPIICGNAYALLTGTPPPGTAGVGTIGTGTIVNTTFSYPTPFGAYYTGSHEQYMMTAAELTAAGISPGNITSLAFENVAAGGNMQNFTIKIAQTTATSATATFVCAGLTTVYTNPSYNNPTVPGWVTYPFSTPFVWNGTSSLVIDITHMNCPSCPTTCVSYTTNGTVYQTNTSYTSVTYAQTDGDCSVITCSPSNGTTTTNQRPNMRLGYQKPADINWLNVTGLYKNVTLTTPVLTTDTNKNVYSAPPVTTVYTAVTNLQGCKSVPSLPDTVFVNPAPNVLVTPAGPQTVCSGFGVTLCIPSGATQSYQWYLNTVAIAGANSNCYTASAAGSYTVTATNLITGCTATSIPTVLTVNVLPVVTASAGGPATFCNGGSVVLTANSASALAWQWKESGSNVPVGGTGPTYTATASGNYTVTVTNSFGCVATSNVIPVTVNTTPNTVAAQGPTTFCTGGSVVLQGPTTPGTLTYQWYNAAGAIGGSTASSYTATTTNNYYVTVTNTSTGCTGTSAPIQVTVGAPPPSAITPSGNVAVCSGNSVTLITVPQTGVVIQWYLNGAPIPGANSATYTTSTAGSYTVNVAVAGTPGCNATSAVAAVVTINALPAATATPQGVTTFCQGGSVNLDANAGTGLSYQWNLGGIPIGGSNATSLTYAANANGSYTVTVKNNATGCIKESNAIPVTVNPLPNVVITPATTPTFCQGGSVVLNTTTGLTNYQWYLVSGSTTTPIASATTSTFTASATGLYYVFAKNSNGCQNTSAPTSVQVNALPVVTTTPTGNTAVCQGNTTTLGTVNDTNNTYQWYRGTTALVGAISNTYNTGVAGTYTVKATNKVTGCIGTSANIILAVNTPPVATASAVGPTTICQDDSVILNTPNAAGLTYQWKYNGNNLVGATGNSYAAKLAGNYTVAVSNATNCTTISNPIVIVVNPRPAAFITYNSPLEFCQGSAVVLVANATPGLTYQWLMNGTPIGNTTNTNISSVTGIYSLKVTNSFSCVTTSDPVNITVYPAPVPAIVQNSDILSTTKAYSSYQWFFNNNAIGGATNGTYAFNENGAYKVRVIDANGCEGTSNQWFVNNVGISSTPIGRSIHVYPNPTNGIVHIDASVKVKVVLRDVTGKAVIEASNVKEIDLGDIANGMYLLYISDLDGRLLKAEKVTKTNN